MNGRHHHLLRLAMFAGIALAIPALALGQVPVDDTGAVIGPYESAAASRTTGNEDIPLLAEAELEELVGPIALYPDDLLAIVLPAAAYPLQIVDAARFLEELDRDSSLQPDPEWDDAVVALLNYPEVIALLNEDIDWTWRLGEAVVAQQEDVVSAVESFRDRAYAAGNLQSDEYQKVERSDGIIEITPVADDVIYVPYYEPERVVVYQPRPVYYYYPRAYPVYYYPYPSSYHFDRGFFWGVTTAFTIGWFTDSLHVYHHSYRGHPYYGLSYRDYWWYRRPSITVYNTTYVRNTNVTINRYARGDRWRPRHNRREYVRHERPRAISHQRVTRDSRIRNARRTEERQAIRFRARPDAATRSRVERRDTVASLRKEPARSGATPRAERREPVARKRTERREPAARQRIERREPAARQRTERREPAARQRTERRETLAQQRVERRPAERRVQRESRPAARMPAARPEVRREAPQRTARNENRRSEVRANARETSQRALRAERGEKRRSEVRAERGEKRRSEVRAERGEKRRSEVRAERSKERRTRR